MGLGLGLGAAALAVPAALVALGVTTKFGCGWFFLALVPFPEALRFFSFCCGCGAVAAAAGEVRRLAGDGDVGLGAALESATAAGTVVGWLLLTLLLLVGVEPGGAGVACLAAPAFGATFLRYDGRTRPGEEPAFTALPVEVLGLGRARALSALLMPLATDAALPLLVRAPKSCCFSVSPPPTAEALPESLRIPNFANMADFFATSSAGAMNSTKVSPNLSTVFVVHGLVT